MEVEAFTASWIEILLEKSQPFLYIWSRLSRPRGLKSDAEAKSEVKEESRLSRPRGLKSRNWFSVR